MIFKGIIKGTMSVSDAFRSMLNRIADYFLDTAARLLALQVQKSFLGLFSNNLFLFSGSGIFFSRVPFLSMKPNLKAGVLLKGVTNIFRKRNTIKLSITLPTIILFML